MRTFEEIEQINCQDCESRQCSIFENCNKDVLEDLNQMKTCKFYKKGEVLFEEGKRPRGLFCVLEGKIKVYQQGIAGKEQIVHLIHDGDIMGHRALFGNDTYSCTGVAMEDSKVCFIPKTEFYDIVNVDGKLTFRIAQLLADELKEAEQNITHTAQQPIIIRLIKTLLALHAQYGFESDGMTLNIEMKREDLANLVGTTRETVTRYLYKLQSQGIIQLKAKKIKIDDLKNLNNLVE